MDVWHVDDPGWGWWIVMSAGMVAFWVLAIYGVVWLLRGGASPRPPGSPPTGPPESPQACLKRRLAAGEIGADEYAALRRLVDDEPPSGDIPRRDVAASSRDPARG